VKRFEGSPFNLCAQCGAELVAPIWTEHLDERHVRHPWPCKACGYQFETSMYFPLSNEACSQVQPQGADRRVH
jgi:ribosomal protein L37AE/L43A